MSIWKSAVSVEDLQARARGTLVEHLGIEYRRVGEDELEGRMPVHEKTWQPLRLLHGGASLAFAETLASTAANLCVDGQRYCLGMAVFANHLRPVHRGWVYGKAKPLHLGEKTQVWEVSISSEEGRLVCACRVTMAVLGS